jgi:hypothetical protein
MLKIISLAVLALTLCTACSKREESVSVQGESTTCDNATPKNCTVIEKTTTVCKTEPDKNGNSVKICTKTETKKGGETTTTVLVTK